jgi:hypothetical protein
VREIIAGFGHEVLVANPRLMEGSKRRRRKSDRRELLFEGLDLRALGFSVTNRKASEYATHLTLEKV